MDDGLGRGVEQLGQIVLDSDATGLGELGDRESRRAEAGQDENVRSGARAAVDLSGDYRLEGEAGCASEPVSRAAEGTAWGSSSEEYRVLGSNCELSPVAPSVGE